MVKGLKQAFNGINNLMKGRNILSSGGCQGFLTPSATLNQLGDFLLDQSRSIKVFFSSHSLIKKQYNAGLSFHRCSQGNYRFLYTRLEVESKFFKRIGTTYFFTAPIKLIPLIGKTFLARLSPKALNCCSSNFSSCFFREAFSSRKAIQWPSAGSWGLFRSSFFCFSSSCSRRHRFLLQPCR